MSLKIFIDFDGTISRNDVSDEMFRELGGERCEVLIQEYLDGKISARKCYLGECEAAGGVRLEMLEKIIDRQEIDQTFKDFVQFCQDRGIELFVLSDGFDYYIERILKQYGLEQVKFLANHLEFRHVEGTRLLSLSPFFPYIDSECPHCANCKRNHLLTLSGDDDIIIYIGDGYSDICPARYADIVFAKKDLVKYCQGENISYYEFQTFKDVVERLEKILQQKRIRKRWQAELRRREIFLQG